MDFITRKFAYLWLKTVETIVNAIVWIYALIHRKKRVTNPKIQSIGAYWNLPPDLTGSNLRLGAWKPFFENDGFQYDNFHINQFSEYVKYVENGNWTNRYLYFSKCFMRRLPQILQAHKYDCIWIDRGMIPYYPRKTAFIEKQLKKVVLKLVVDTTDGSDYQSNPELMEDTFRQADEITVGYKYLKELFSNRFQVTQVFWTIPTDQYQLKNDYSLSSPPVIGWMGSPANFQFVREIIPELKKLAEKQNFIFRYICRENFNVELSGINAEHHTYKDPYYEILKSFDLGISPFLRIDLGTKGKIAMKHQEFLLMGVPQVCSPVAISEFVEHEKHVLIAEQTDQWTSLLESLFASHELRKTLGANSKKLFAETYNYNSQYQKLKRVLTNA
jgi:hypothetical protein